MDGRCTHPSIHTWEDGRMDIKQTEPKVKKVVRIDAELFIRLAKYAEGVDFPSQNAFFNHVIKAGIEALEKPNPSIEPPEYDKVTEGYKPDMEEDIKKAISGKTKPKTVTLENKELIADIKTVDREEDPKPSLKTLGFDVDNLKF